MNSLRFHKMHGLGNDFVIIDDASAAGLLTPGRIRWLGDRHRGVGFDQMAVLEEAPDCDAFITYYNADGTRAGACGNATRCIADLVARKLGKRKVLLRIAAGPLPAEILDDGRVRVEMTTPRTGWQDVPVAEPCDTLELPLDFEGLPRPVACSFGNPHAVFFVDDLDALDVKRLGAALEVHPFFPERANIGFAQVLGPGRIRLRVFERGAGLTLACGSGACAAFTGAVRRGLAAGSADLILDGGTLQIAWPGEGPVIMTGPVARSFQGVIDPADMEDMDLTDA